MGDVVLDVQVAANGSVAQGCDTLRGYAHCARTGPGIVVLLINFDLSATYSVSLSGLTAAEQTERHM